MKFILACLVILLAIGAGYYYVGSRSPTFVPVPPAVNVTAEPSQNVNTTVPAVMTVAEGLDTPWALAFLPDNSILVTERPGRVRLISPDGHLQVDPVATIANVKEIGEGGLLGIAIHPDFTTNHFVYLYYTYSGTDNSLNRVVRMTYQNNRLSDEKVILDNILGSANHDGGRIKFGPDKYLYIGTGDAERPSQAQDTKTLGGKILRITDSGEPAPGNPFNNPVYSYGHRNVQGLTWDEKNQLWATEHGRSGAQSGLDELNLIEAGKNYGWPTIQGNQTKAGMETAKLNSGDTTWAPSGIAFLNGSVYFGGLKGQSLYEATITQIPIQLEPHFSGEYGRIRDVVVGPDQRIYFTTSNLDGRGSPGKGDDKVISVDPTSLQ